MQAGPLIKKHMTLARAALILRAAIVGANFGVMIGLATMLGIGQFGALLYSWSIALVCATFISAGGPMVLLRDLSDRHGMRWAGIWTYICVLPLFLAGLIYPALAWVWPELALLPILSAALSINLSACVASILRAKGSVNISMVLRDAGPFVALGCGALLGTDGAVESAITTAALINVVFVIMALISARNFGMVPSDQTACGMRKGKLALWGTAIVGVAIAQMDLVLGGAVLSAEAFGIYALLRRIANLVALPVTVATWVSAPKVAAAFAAGDWVALKRASAEGSRTAWYPAIAFCGFACVGICFAGLLSIVPVSTTILPVAGVLLAGALLQAYWASGYTVATLTDAPVLSLAARGIVLVGYCAIAMAQGGALTMIGNAAAYVLAMSAGSFWLWYMLRRRFEIDTSAAVLRGDAGGIWKAF